MAAEAAAAAAPLVAGLAPAVAAVAPDPAAAAAAALAAAADVGDVAGNRIAQLQGDARLLLAERKRISKELKNEDAKRKRLMDKAKQLSDDDLVTILGARAEARTRAAAKAKAKAKAKGE